MLRTFRTTKPVPRRWLVGKPTASHRLRSLRLLRVATSFASPSALSHDPPPDYRPRGFTTPQVDRTLSLSECCCMVNAETYILLCLTGLLAFVEQFLPLGSTQWDELQYAYNRNLPAEWPQRDVESLRRKFFALKNARKQVNNNGLACLCSWCIY